LPFLNRCEHYFRGQRTIEEEHVWLAAMHLQGAAQQWYMRLERDEGTLGGAASASCWTCALGHR
jgi:hypothetical protein